MVFCFHSILQPTTEEEKESALQSLLRTNRQKGLCMKFIPIDDLLSLAFRKIATDDEEAPNSLKSLPPGLTVTEVTAPWLLVDKKTKRNKYEGVRYVCVHPVTWI